MINPAPFFVWAGGKRRLLQQIAERYPNELADGRIDNYIEPFVGGGAVFFDVMQKYNIAHATLMDINPQIINAYTQIRDNPDKVTALLAKLQNSYNNISLIEKEVMYYDIRRAYNAYTALDEVSAANFIFLCKAFFNGAYRVNKKGELNTPFGKKPKLTFYSEDNIHACSKALQNANLICGDYKMCERLIDERTFLFFDPPYRPTEKSGYLKYTATPFSDVEQIELSDFYELADIKGARLMLCNSFSGDGFLETLYKDFYFHNMHVNSLVSGDPSYRKMRTEILITNYAR